MHPLEPEQTRKLTVALEAVITYILSLAGIRGSLSRQSFDQAGDL